MLPSDADDYRRVSETALVRALGQRDGLALAEVYHRTVPAVHAVARRLLSGSVEVEALLRQVYAALWEQPPVDAPLEGWLRARTFEAGAAHLRDTSTAPTAPTVAALLPDLPRAEPRYLDSAERALADLDEGERLVLLRAHDTGQPAVDQGGDAGAALERALLALAGPEPTGDDAPEGELGPLGDYVLGLLPPTDAEALTARVVDSPDDGARVRALRRGRRKLEGLPPTPDMGQRILVAVLVASPAARAGAGGSLVEAPGGRLDRTDLDDATAADPEVEAARTGTSPGPDAAPGSAAALDEEVAVPSGAVAVAPDTADVDVFEDPVPEEPRDAGSPPLPSALDGDHEDEGEVSPPASGDEHAEPATGRRLTSVAVAADDDADGGGGDDGRATTTALPGAEDTHDGEAGSGALGDATRVEEADDAGPAEGDEGDEEHEEARGFAARVLRLLGYLLLLGLGVLAGLFLGQLLVNLL